MDGSARRDDRLDRLGDLAQRMKDAAPVGWRSLIESYIYGHARIHAHLRRVGGDKASWASDEASATDLCLTYDWPGSALGKDLVFYLRESWERFYVENVVKLDGRVDQVKVAMLVDVPKFLEHGEGFTIGGVLPCTKRLQFLEDCQECRVDGPELLRNRTGIPRGGPQAYGEPDRPPWASANDGIGRRRHAKRRLELDAQTPHELVECRAQAMDDVADDWPPEDGGRLSGCFGPEDHVSAAGREGFNPECWLQVNAVSIAREHSDQSFQGINVFVRPVNLGLGV